MSTYVGIWTLTALVGLAHAHIAAFHPAMYCAYGNTPGVKDLNNDAPVKPLYQLSYDEFWLHNSNNCPKFPPEEGVYLELPSGGTFTLEHASNSACTSMHPYNKPTAWGDCKDHPDDYSVQNLGGLEPTTSGGVPSPNLHAANESTAAGTAFAISYNSDITKVTPENTVVFSVRRNTPWKRIVTYDVPDGMPPCPPGGCTCIWGWIPGGYGQPNMNMNAYKCNVTNVSSSPKVIGNPKPPVWCEEDAASCVQGPKQIMLWHQLEANNIEVEGYDRSGQPKSPGYNEKCGFKDGAQNDIFVESGATATGHSKRMRRGRNNVF